MEDDESLPNQALYFVLAYLPLHQLLLMSQVCKSLRDVVRDDVLMWLDIVVESPLNLRLTDQILINITSKARGRLRTLALLKCQKISDDALIQVVTANPLLSKLYVPACTGLTPEGVLRAIKTITANANAFSCLKINGIYNIKKEDLLTLQSLIPQTTKIKSRFYHKYRSSSFSSIDKDDRSIEVEICPLCEEVKLVFDCPTETDCKGCLQCIPRCEACGTCNSKDEDEQGETLCNDNVCLDCWLGIPKCNHCNKPFCPRHAHNQVYSHGSQGFVCEVCHDKSLKTCWQE